MILLHFLEFRLRALVEALLVRLRYSSPAFRRLERRMRSLYRGDSPYAVSRHYWNDYSYGETPIPTLAMIAEEVALGADDCWVELGSGRGRGCFWLHTVYGCRVIGIEKVPTFVERARMAGEGPEFYMADLTDFDYSKATVAYLCGSLLSDEKLDEVREALEAMPVGGRLVTVSDPIDSPYFALKQERPASFSWGRATLFFHQKVDISRQAVRRPIRSA